MATAVTTVRARYAETDRMGVVYYANYLVWFEVARTDLLRTLGWSYREMEETGVNLPVIEAHCEYRRPARYDDRVDVHTEARVLSPVRLRFDYRVQLAGANDAIASGHTVHAATTTEGKPCRLPERVRKALA